MLKANAVFSSFSAGDLAKIKTFYTETLRLKVEEDKMMGLNISLPQGGMVYVYQKDDHMPATFTILNFEVSNIDEEVENLKSQGVMFEQYAGMTDEMGIARGLSNNRGPDIAWFKDPAGNILSLMQTS